MKKGIIIKGYSGFYYVEYEGQVYECSLRGKNRLKDDKFLPGDRVLFTIIDGTKGVIEEVLPRKNQLIRPPIANMDQVIIVKAIKTPPPDLWLIDRLTILALWNNIEPIICLNKGDLKENTGENIKEIYQGSFRVIVTSTKTGMGIDELKNILKGKISVLAGPSGVGKSSLLNALDPNLQLKVGEISYKSKRGKHTTRHVELIPLEFGGLVADTPGFSTLNLPSDLKREELSSLFPDFYPYAHNCKFSTCLHKNEPQCCVKAGVEMGEINSKRYNNYLTFLEEIIKQERSF